MVMSKTLIKGFLRGFAGADDGDGWFDDIAMSEN